MRRGNCLMRYRFPKLSSRAKTQVEVYLSTLALQRMATGRSGEAENLLKRCIDIIEEDTGIGSAKSLYCFNNLALLYLRQQRYREARSYAQRAVELAKGPTELSNR